MANPVLNSVRNERVTLGAIPLTDSQRLTRGQVVSATLFLLSIVTLVAIAVIYVGDAISPSLAMTAGTVGAGGLFLTSMLMMFSHKLQGGSAFIGFIFAVLEGLMVGGFTYYVSQYDFQGESGWSLVTQAIAGTIGLFFVGLGLYASKIIRVTDRFRMFLGMATLGFFALYAINFGISLIFGKNFLFSGGPLPIIIALAAIVIATFCLIRDFDTVEEMVQAGSDSKMKWSLATSLMVTLVWMYIEILRLLFLTRR